VEELRGQATILVVDDDDGVLRLARAILEGRGYRVLEASDGASALRAIGTAGGAVDLAVLDVLMPGMRGPELASRVVELFPSIRVIYMSGYTDGAPLGNRPLLKKPFTVEALLQSVRDALG
jgi:two-component system, cell cycle sensor histidine kinase and response regulator CckA